MRSSNNFRDWPDLLSPLELLPGISVALSTLSFWHTCASVLVFLITLCVHTFLLLGVHPLSFLLNLQSITKFTLVYWVIRSDIGQYPYKDRNGRKSKSLKVESRGNTPGGVRGQSPLKLKSLSTSKVWKNPFPGTLSCFKQPLTKDPFLCFNLFKAFFQRNKPGFDNGQFPNALYS